MLNGAEDLGQSDTRFGNINWPVEELTFLQLKADAAQFYAELTPFLKSWMTDNHIADAIDFQQRWILGSDHQTDDIASYSHDIPSMIASTLQGTHTPVIVQPVKLTFAADRYHSTAESWAREVVWYGRKQVLHKRRIHYVVN
jgi:hypothetical protein